MKTGKKRIDENQKVTLTLGQIRKLVMEEAGFHNDHPGEHDSMTIDYDGQRVFILHTSSERTIIVADTPMGLCAECTGQDDYHNEKIREFCQTAFQMKVGQNTPSPFGGKLARVG